MNIKNFVLISVVVFVFIFLFDMVVHGFLLDNIYAKSPELWRKDADMKVPFMIMTYALSAVLMVFIFIRKMKVKNLQEGVCAGTHLGILLGILGAASYAWMPISLVLAFFWFLAAFVKTIAVGAITGALYKQ